MSYSGKRGLNIYRNSVFESIGTVSIYPWPLTTMLILFFMLLDLVILVSMIYRQYLKLKGDIAPVSD